MNAQFNVSNETRREQLKQGNELPVPVEVEINFSELSQQDRELIMRHSVLKGDNLFPGYGQRIDKPYLRACFPYKIEHHIGTPRKGDLASLDAYDLDSLLFALGQASRYIDVELPKKREEKIAEEREQKIDWLQTHKALSYASKFESYKKMFEDYRIPVQVQAEFKSGFEAHEQKQDEKEAERAAKQKAREEAKQKTIQQRENWIENKGSICLKKMLNGGYELRMSYEQERAEKEVPDFDIDEQGERFEWETRGNPSCDALDIAEEEHGKVVWVTRDIYLVELFAKRIL